MWYVRFGGDEFGPFEHEELTHFLLQLGTASAVEVREGEVGDWVPSETVPLLSVLYQDSVADEAGGPMTEDDRTLMSSDLSPELLAEFRDLLDANEEEAESVEVSELPAVEQQTKPSEIFLRDPENVHTESSPPSDNLALSEMLSGVQSQQTESSVGDKLGSFREPRTDAMMIASPLKKDGQKKPSPDETNTKASRSGLIPPKRSEVPSGVPMTASDSTSKPIPAARVQPPSPPQSPPQPYTAPKARNPLRIGMVALGVTFFLGGAGVLGIWMLTKDGEISSAKTHSKPPVSKSDQSAIQLKKGGGENKAFTFSESEVDVESKKNNQNAEVSEGTDKQGEDAKTGSGETKKQVLKEKTATPASKTAKSVDGLQKRTKPSTGKATKRYGNARKFGRARAKKNTKTLIRLDRTQINRVMSRRSALLKACGGKKGVQVTASLVILGSGKVRRAQLNDFGKVKPTEKACMLKVLKETRFPKTQTPSSQIRIPIKL